MGGRAGRFHRSQEGIGSVPATFVYNPLCKAVLDDAALRQQNEPGSRAVLVGSQISSERRRNLSAQRSSNIKAYLVKEKGIDAAMIRVRVSSEDAGKVQVWLVPEGASLADVPGRAAQEQPTGKGRR